MSMISELVKGLRKLGNQWKHNDVAGFNLIFDAADTIETLSEKVRASNLHNGWIPVSERLPEEYGEYLVTKRTIGWNCEEYGSNDIAYFDSDGFHKADKVTAWMPLPEPYKGGDEA